MKNLMLIAAVSFGMTVSACAQVKIPDAVKNAFQKEYPGTKVRRKVAIMKQALSRKAMK
jgi:hypothetical protein